MSQDTAGFAEFFSAAWDACVRAVAASIGSMTLAEDQTAEAFARAWAAWPKVSVHPAPRAWVVRTALNTGATWWRRRKSEMQLLDHDLAVVQQQPAGLDATLLTSLRHLPTRQREVVVLRVFLDLDIETTARHLGVAPGTVRAHLSRAMTALRRELIPANPSQI